MFAAEWTTGPVTSTELTASAYLTSRSTIIFEKLVVSQLVKSFSEFDKIRNFLTIVTESYHWILSWTNQILPLILLL
jgi:hypothetical protein